MAKLKICSSMIDGIELVILDKDGTVIDLYYCWSQIVGYRVDAAKVKLGFNDAQKKEVMYAMGIDLENQRIRDGGPVGFKRREVVMQAMMDALSALGFPDTYEICCQAFDEADRKSRDNLKEIVKPTEGIVKFITDLHNKGCRVAIATTDRTERARWTVELLGVSHVVDMIIGSDKVKNHKPEAETVELILRELAVNKKSAVIIGDAITDIEMGINAGLSASIGFCSGLTPREKFLEKTKYTVDSITQIEVI